MKDLFVRTFLLVGQIIGYLLVVVSYVLERLDPSPEDANENVDLYEVELDDDD